MISEADRATGKELRRTYRALLRFHPDRRDTALQDVLAAYEVLGDLTRRAANDRRNDLVLEPARGRYAFSVGTPAAATLSPAQPFTRWTR